MAYPGPRGAPYPAGTLVAIEQDGSGVGQFGHFLWGTAYDPAHLTSTWGGPRILTSGPDLARDFKANVHQGDWGSGKEQPLRAMRASLDASMVTTGGRTSDSCASGARLAVVILTDEDDCSESGTAKHVTSDDACHATGASTTTIDDQYFDPISDFVDYLDTTVGGGRSGQPPIVARPSPASTTSGAAAGCTGTAFDSAANPRRLGAFLDRLDAAHAGRTTAAQHLPAVRAMRSWRLLRSIIPQTLPLNQAPADYRMMVVSVLKASGAVVGCHMEPASSPAASAQSAGVVYAPAPPGGLPTLTFQDDCHLGLGDQIDIKILCAG